MSAEQKLQLVVNRTGTDQDFFESREAYEQYKKEEEYLRTLPTEESNTFEWREFLKLLFFGG